MQAVARGGSVGSDEPPSQTKGPLFYAKRSTFYNKRSTFYNTGPLFLIKGPPLVQLLSNRSTIRKIKCHFLKKVHQHLYKRPNIHTKYLFLFIGLYLPLVACHVLHQSFPF